MLVFFLLFKIIDFKKFKKGWENGNSAEALTLHTKIAASDWDQNKDWLKTMKRVLLRK